jgi:protein-S-isoprenylcysteine O-methyltransferase Ste14
MKQAHLLVLIQFILFTVLASAFFALPGASSPPARVAGIVLAGVGVALGLLAFRAHLTTNPGLPNISPEPNQRAQLVETGIYARIRHPIYTAVLACCIGAALFHGHIATVAVAGVIVVFFTYKSWFEERLLKEAYPQYSEYMRRTGRFLPFL